MRTGLYSEILMEVSMKIVLAGIAFAAMAFASTQTFAEGRWKQVENKENCAVWDEEPASNETVSWTGDCKDGKANGYGKQVWRYYDFPKWKGTLRGWRKSTYIGMMRGGKKDGHGVLTWPDGGKYDGQWRNNKRDGKGTWITADGEKCEGIWHYQKMVGQGKTERDGKTMKCSVLDGKISVSNQ